MLENISVVLSSVCVQVFSLYFPHTILCLFPILKDKYEQENHYFLQFSFFNALLGVLLVLK